MMWILHIVCLLFFIPALILTIPLHLILKACSKNKKEVVFVSEEEYKKKNSRPKGFELGRL